MPEALAAVKRELGPDAIILGTRTLPTDGLAGLLTRERVEIRAAPPGLASPAPRAGKPGPAAPAPQLIAATNPAAAHKPKPKPAPVTQPAVQKAVASKPAPATGPRLAVAPPRPSTGGPDADDALRRMVQRMVENDVAESLAQRLVHQAAERAADRSPAALREALRAELRSLLPTHSGIEVASKDGPRVVALVGPPGSGKTTTTAKLAAQLALREGRRVLILSLDMYRIASHDQTRRLADLVGCDFLAAQSAGQIRSLAPQLREFNVVLVDTPGISPADRGRFMRLAVMLRGLRPDDVYLVVPAVVTESAQARSAALFRPLGIRGAIVSRTDEAAGLGVLLNVSDRLGIPCAFFTSGQAIPGGLETACADGLSPLMSE